MSVPTISIRFESTVPIREVYTRTTEPLIRVMTVMTNHTRFPDFEVGKGMNPLQSLEK